MVSRCIINVATGPYVPRQQKLRQSIERVGFRGDLLFWADELPAECPPHSESPYAFKPHAFYAALRQGYDQVLWLDAACRVVRDMAPLWARMERDRVWFVGDGWNVGQWSTDLCLRYFLLSRDDAAELRMIYACAMGLDFRPRGDERDWDTLTEHLLTSWFYTANAGLFIGPWVFSADAPEYGPANALMPEHLKGRAGHRHDQTCMSILLDHFGLPMNANEQFTMHGAGTPGGQWAAHASDQAIIVQGAP
jgi:hypothetical protein